MSDIGYYSQIEGGIFGQPDGGGSDPATRAALQEETADANRRIIEALVQPSA